ncbi:MAG: UDP-glucose 4-epimerase GalE [Clostridiales bacterium]|nr:UDP-glucose 4-epimerase GalE [Clostridiales bacterium]
MSILLTGGLGYIGSHTAVELLNRGEDVIIVDDLSNSKIIVKNKIMQITGKKFKFIKADLKNLKKTEKIFKNNNISAVVHFAGYKIVGESLNHPIKYYENNILITLNLLKCMEKYNVYNMVFSSSASIYGDQNEMPVKETFSTHANNPYSRTKLYIEEILKDFYNSNNKFNFAILRYFNPVGAHESGLIGEDPNDTPTNLMPYITKVATGELKELSIFGNDYSTKDGTGVRDFIHVCDLAIGHALALNKLKEKPGVFICNLGTGKGYTVLETVTTFNKVNGNLVKYKFVERRSGDIAISYADTTKAEKELKFKAKYNLEEMCKTSYKFEKNNK